MPRDTFRCTQGSNLGPLLFNIYIYDIFFSEVFEMRNFADDNSPYNVNLSINEVIEYLEKQTTSLIIGNQTPINGISYFK